ncbi:MAG: alpha/beta hydrolase [Candidatus Microsaccharimonas sossegonensis]|uniref:Alpha/beta hydrolase n=1 Tax=Candidatus Microsaccharimonas sossegonensis TaxID=2506948 RepID=A0A4Q0AI34_9BACT|nr:MAG: alpha/beta hydrolase [Candidatus Microsaccharimonas sossegonensis]
MAKQTIIFIHGFRGTHHGLELIAKHLEGFETIIPDLPGFAEGDRLQRYDLPSYVDWLHQFIVRLDLNTPPILLGHSFGSIVTAAYAAKHTDTIEKLVLVNPIGAPALEGPRAVMTKLALFYYWLGTKLPGKLSHSWLASQTVTKIMSQTMTKSKDKALRAYIDDQHRQYFSLFHSAQSVSEAFATSVNHSVRDFARNITTPTLLIAGTKDDITPIEKQQELVELFPDATLEVIEDVGHLTHYETPDQVALFVSRFANSL